MPLKYIYGLFLCLILGGISSAAYSNGDFRHFWHNITSPEQNFGILSFSPPPEPYVESGSFPGESISRIKISSDYTFFRVRLHMDTELYSGDTVWVAFDTYARDLGESILPNGASIGDGGDTMRAESAIRIPIGGDRADLYVIPSYDIYGIKSQVRIDTVVSTKSDVGVWNRVRWKTNYFTNATQYIGKLNISDSDDPYQILSAVLSFGNSPGQGNLHLHPDGSFNYIPLEGFTGNDLFSYYLNDGNSNSTLVPVSIRVEFPVGQEKALTGIDGTQFTIYPNPGKDIFFIKAFQLYDDASVFVTDMTGREIIRKPIINIPTRINIEDVVPGVYIFNINFDHEMEMHRVIIQ